MAHKGNPPGENDDPTSGDATGPRSAGGRPARSTSPRSGAEAAASAPGGSAGDPRKSPDKTGRSRGGTGGFPDDTGDSPADAVPSDSEPGDAELSDADLSEADQVLLDQAARDLVAEMRTDMLRAQADLINFRSRVERDRAANREAIIGEVIRSLLPALDDLARAEAHGDLVEGAPLTIVAQKLRGAFEKYGLRQVGEKGEPFDPAFHEAVVQVPSTDVTVDTIAEVFEPGYVLGDRLVRPAKVAVSVRTEE